MYEKNTNKILTMNDILLLKLENKFKEDFWLDLIVNFNFSYEVQKYFIYNKLNYEYEITYLLLYQNLYLDLLQYIINNKEIMHASTKESICTYQKLTKSFILKNRLLFFEDCWDDLYHYQKHLPRKFKNQLVNHYMKKYKFPKI